MISHDRCGKTVHRPCSSCISSIENLTRTLLSSPCQLGLGERLSYLRLSHYTDGFITDLYQNSSLEVLLRMKRTLKSLLPRE